MKHILKQKLRRSLKKLLRSALNSKIFINEWKQALEYIHRIDNYQLLSQLQSCGEQVQLIGQVTITDPKSTIIGNNVCIDTNTYLETSGGLTIGNNTHVCRNVTINTINFISSVNEFLNEQIGQPKPVSIGKNVWIGMNVTIFPGVNIGDGAIIRLGAVVTSDVPPSAIIGGGANQVLEYRNVHRERTLEREDSDYKVSSAPLFTSKTECSHKSSDELLFVVTTGRSGSTTLSRWLSQHSKVTCLHEPRRQLIRLSTEFANGEKNAFQVRGELEAIYLNSSTFPVGIYGESDQKFWNLITILSDILPRCKFIWLVRDGRDVVASTYGRGWFNEEIEHRYGNPVTTDQLILHRWMFYRLNGGKCGALTHQKWESLSIFERNCWYWEYVNQSIQKQLQFLPQKRWMMLRIEELEQKSADIFNFLGVVSEPLSIPTANDYASVSDYYPGRMANSYHWKTWSYAEKMSFVSLCGGSMDRYYGSWRSSFFEIAGQAVPH